MAGGCGKGGDDQVDTESARDAHRAGDMDLVGQTGDERPGDMIVLHYKVI